MTRIFLAAELLLIALLPRYGDLFQHGHALRFVAIYLAAGAAYLLALRGFGEIARRYRPKIFWLAAIALRLAIFPMPPGDDMPRYLWEGKVQLQGVNPYLNGPGDPALAPLRDEIWPKINHPEWPAIYPPATELLFAAMSRVWSSPWFFKAIFATADLLVCFLVLRLNVGADRHCAAAWYAWSPLPVCAFAGAGHFDSLLLVCLTGAVWMLHRARPLDAGRFAWPWCIASVALLGAAIAIKAVPLLLLPVWAIALGRRSWLLALSLAIPWLAALPFGGWRVVHAPLARFAEVSQFNPALWWLMDYVPAVMRNTVNAGWNVILPFAGLNPYYENTRYQFLTALAVVVIAVKLRRDWRRAALWTLGAALILSPVLHPWYVTWILPLACWRKDFAWFVLALSAPICLLVWEAGLFWEAWKMTAPLHLLVVLPPVIALAASSMFKVQSSKFGAAAPRQDNASASDDFEL